MRPAGTNAAGVIEELPLGAPPWRTALDDPRSQLFYAVEARVYRPGAAAIAYTYGAGTRAAGTLSLDSDPVETYTTLRASDHGYVSLANDVIGSQAYPPYLAQPFAYDRAFNLDPGDHSVGYGWGSVRLANADGVWDGVVAANVNDGRQIRVLLGRKAFDADRGVHVDPPYGELVEIFRGVQSPWFLAETALDIPLRDATYHIERPIQTSVYAGTGGAEGTADLKGLPKPKTRGGTGANPVLNVTPVLIDPTNRIYQYTDAAGTVEALYERGYETFIDDGDVAATYAALAATVVASGHFARADAVGMCKLGATPVGLITADVTGAFPAAGAQTRLANIARYLLAEDLAVPAEDIDTAAFTGLAAVDPYTAGLFIGAQHFLGADILGAVLGSIGGKLVTSRSGRLRPFVLAAPPAGVRPVATYTTAEIVSMRPRALPSGLSPPTYRWRVGYQRNHTLQVSDLSTSVTDARRQFLAEPYRYATWLDVAILGSYRRPNDPPPLPGVLLSASDAEDVADALGAFWGQRRRLYDVTLWLQPLEREIGEVVVVSYPIEDFASGKLATIVGEQFRPGESTVTLQVIV